MIEIIVLVVVLIVGVPILMIFAMASGFSRFFGAIRMENTQFNEYQQKKILGTLEEVDDFDSLEI